MYNFAGRGNFGGNFVLAGTLFCGPWNNRKNLVPQAPIAPLRAETRLVSPQSHSETEERPELSVLSHWLLKPLRPSQEVNKTITPLRRWKDIRRRALLK